MCVTSCVVWGEVTGAYPPMWPSKTGLGPVSQIRHKSHRLTNRGLTPVFGFEGQAVDPGAHRLGARPCGDVAVGRRDRDPLLRHARPSIAGRTRCVEPDAIVHDFTVQSEAFNAAPVMRSADTLGGACST